MPDAAGLLFLQVVFFAMGSCFGAVAGFFVPLPPIANPEPAPPLPPPAAVVQHQTVEHHHHHVDQRHHRQGGDGDAAGALLGGLLLLGLLGAIFGGKREDRR